VASLVSSAFLRRKAAIFCSGPSYFRMKCGELSSSHEEALSDAGDEKSNVKREKKTILFMEGES
jgi:hypothetical protein